MKYKLKQGAELTLTEAKRPDLSFWMAARIMPAHLVSQFIKLRNLADDDDSNELQETIAASRAATLTDEQLQAQLDFQYRCVEYLLAGACTVQELQANEFKLLYNFALYGEKVAQALLSAKKNDDPAKVIERTQASKPVSKFRRKR